MYCRTCHAAVRREQNYCRECGSALENNVYFTDPPNGKDTSGGYTKWIAATVAVVAVISVLCGAFVFFFGDSEEDIAIETVKNGYLGEFTDLTVYEILEQFRVDYENESWSCITTNSGKQIVQVDFENDSTDWGRVQFEMLNDDVFRIIKAQDSPTNEYDSSKIICIFASAYLLQKGLEDETPEIEAVYIAFNEADGSELLYGASSSYEGDRTQLHTLFYQEPLNQSVAELLLISGILPEDDSVEKNGDATMTEVTVADNTVSTNAEEKLTVATDVITPFNSVAGNALASVMMGKNNFTMAETGTHQSLFNMTEFMQFTFENYLIPTSFCVVDMDQDGTNEIIVGMDTNVDGFRLVLHYEYGTVYGYPFGFRGLTAVSTDGLVTGSSSAFESSTSRLSFSGLSIDYYNLSYAEEQIALASWQDATWYDFTEENVGKFFPNMDISFILPSAPPSSSIRQQKESFETYIDGYVKYGTEELRIRSGPGTEYEEVGRLREGTQVVILEIANSGNREWGRTDRGWVCMDYIQEGEPSASYIDTSSVYALDYINGTTGDVLNRIGRNYIMGSGFSGSKLFYYGSNTNIQFGFVPYDWTNPSISGNEPISVILVGGNARISQSLSADMNKAQLDTAAWNTPNVINVSGQYTYGEMWGSVYMYEIETTDARILYMWYLDDGADVNYRASEVTISPK